MSVTISFCLSPATRFFLFMGGGGGGWGGRRTRRRDLGGASCLGIYFNFSKVTENAFGTIKISFFFHIFSDVAIGSSKIHPH